MYEEIRQAIDEIKRCVIVMQKNIWNVADLALVLGVSPSRIRHLAASNVIPFYKQNGSLFFKREEIEAWQTQNRIATKAEIKTIASSRIATGRIK